MASLFISHSKSDKALIKFFKETIENTQFLRAILMEYEDLTHQNAGIVITSKIMSNDCKCLIVLLGKSILFPSGYNYSFTHNWVGYEIGVAPCRGIPIIVFEEDSMDFNDIVHFPVPYLNHYVKYKQDSTDTTNSRYIGELLKIIAFNTHYSREIFPQHVKCHWDHCNAQYLYWNKNRILPELMPCPVCRGIFSPGVADEVLTREKNPNEHFPTGVV